MTNIVHSQVNDEHVLDVGKVHGDVSATTN